MSAMSAMKVLFVSSEVAPLAKAGGLGDVVGSLPKALRKQGVDVRILMPFYGMVNRSKFQADYRFNYQFSFRRGTADVYVHKLVLDGVPIYLLESWPFFGISPEGYHLYTDWGWDLPRFIFFSQTALATAWHLGQGADGGEPFFPDIVHAHDWHTGLVPFLISEARSEPTWQPVGTVLTLHNMAYQGAAAGGFLWSVGVPGRHQPDLVYQDKTDNLLGIGLAYADQINTVSPRHAIEIQYPRFGEGLEGLLRVRQADLYGILNGIDMERYNPATDRHLAHHYSVDDFIAGKRQNKIALQRRVGLPERPDVPVIGMVTRVDDQKGVDLAVPALRDLLTTEDAQFVGLGAAKPGSLDQRDRDLLAAFQGLGYEPPLFFKARGIVEYLPELAQLIYAGCDLFLMPSRYEPCGTSQMIAMRYGALPVVRETGGLADTVQNFDNGPAEVGTGFLFLWEEPYAVRETLRWAINTFRYRPEAFQRMQRRAMGLDWSWDNSTQQYLAMYERALARHR